MAACIVAILVQGMVLWPAMTVAFARLVGRPARVVHLGFGSVLWSRAFSPTSVEVHALPLGASVAWGDDEVVPTPVGWAAHALLLVSWTAVGLALGPASLVAVSRFVLAALTYRDTGIGGWVGGWSAASEHTAGAPLAAVVAALAAHAGVNTLQSVLHALAAKVGTWAVMVVFLVLPLTWAAWLVWLDLR